MLLNVAICDDHEIFIEGLKKELNNLFDMYDVKVKIDCFENGDKLLEYVKNNASSIDILFLDVDMPGSSGIDVAREIRKNDKNMMLIFISSYEQYVFQAIEFGPYRYIRKAAMDKELRPAVRNACAYFKYKDNKCVFVKSDNKEYVVRVSDIVYFETEGRKISIHMSDGNILQTRKTVKQMLSEFSLEQFIKLHSGCVVNVKYISDFTNYSITLENGEELVVSRANIKTIRKALMNYWSSR